MKKQCEICGKNIDETELTQKKTNNTTVSVCPKCLERWNDPSSKLSDDPRTASEVLVSGLKCFGVWFVLLLIPACITIVLKNNGFILGGLPTFIMYALAFWGIKKSGSAIKENSIYNCKKKKSEREERNAKLYKKLWEDDPVYRTLKKYIEPDSEAPAYSEDRNALQSSTKETDEMVTQSKRCSNPLLDVKCEQCGKLLLGQARIWMEKDGTDRYFCNECYISQFSDAEVVKNAEERLVYHEKMLREKEMARKKEQKKPSMRNKLSLLKSFPHKFLVSISLISLILIYWICGFTSYFVSAFFAACAVILLRIFLIPHLEKKAKQNLYKKVIIYASSIVLIFCLIEFVCARPYPDAFLEKTIYTSDMHAQVSTMTDTGAIRFNSVIKFRKKLKNASMEEVYLTPEKTIKLPQENLSKFNGETISGDPYIGFHYRTDDYSYYIVPTNLCEDYKGIANTGGDNGCKLISSKNSDLVHVYTCQYARNIIDSNKIYYNTAAESEFYGNDYCSRCGNVVRQNY